MRISKIEFGGEEMSSNGGPWEPESTVETVCTVILRTSVGIGMGRGQKENDGTYTTRRRKVLFRRVDLKGRSRGRWKFWCETVNSRERI